MPLVEDNESGALGGTCGGSVVVVVVVVVVVDVVVVVAFGSRTVASTFTRGPYTQFASAGYTSKRTGPNPVVTGLLPENIEESKVKVVVFPAT